MTTLINGKPLAQWTSRQLKAEISQMRGSMPYRLLNDDEKRERGLPVTDDEMRAYINKAYGGTVG